MCMPHVNLAIYLLMVKHCITVNGKPYLLNPVTNSLKFIKESPFSSSSRNKRLANISECAPHDQGKSRTNNPLNCSKSIRYCSR